MNIHEYQAKALFKKYEIPTLKGVLIENSTEAPSACDILGGNLWVVKAQVHAGGRGKAGGVKVVDTPGAAETVAKSMLGK